MAEIRFNYGDKFTQTTDTNTGIGSTNPAAKLDVAGNTKAGSLRVSGIATLSSYQGFVNTKLSTTENIIVEAGQSGSVSGEVVVGTGQTISVSTGATTGQGGIQSLKVYETFMPPVGGTADRPTDVKPGMVYYNKDFKTIEFWDGNFWKQVDNTTQSGSVVCWGGVDPAVPAAKKIISHVNIASKGNAVNFGGSLDTAGHTAGMSNEIRGVFAGRTTPSESIEYITLASEGNSIDFGDLTGSRDRASGLSSSTRGLIAGGRVPSAINIIDYIEIMTLGNALDFGDLTVATKSPSTTSNGTRGILAHQGTVAELTISSKGNSVDIGKDIFSGEYQCGGASSGTRGMWASGQAVGAEPVTESIRGVEIASAGNAIEFGNLTVKRSHASGSGSCTRGIWWGGWVAPLAQNVIDYVSIQSGGEAEDFGDLSSKVYNPGVASDCHGGIGGY